MGETLVRPGDLVIEFGCGVLGSIIRWATRSWCEPPTRATHVGRMVSSEHIAEAGWRFVIRELDFKRRIQVWRYLPGLSAAAIDCMRMRAEHYLGRQYGWWKLLPQLADGLLERLIPFRRRVHLFRRLIGITDYPICSEEVAVAYRDCAGITFGIVPARATTPDDILDWVSRAWQWGCVYDNTR